MHEAKTIVCHSEWQLGSISRFSPDSVRDDCAMGRLNMSL